MIQRTGAILAVILALISALGLSAARADETALATALRAANAEIQVDPAGLITSVEIREDEKLTPEQWKLLASLSAVKRLVLYGTGLNDETLASLGTLPTLEKFVCGSAQVSDAGFAAMGKWKNLRSATFFHAAAGRKVPFDGSGCAAFAGLPHFESFSMGGADFKDAGMAALAKSTGLKEVRIWHTYRTSAGNVHLEALQNLTSLWFAPDSRQTVDAIPHIAKLPKLEKLMLSETRLTGAQLEPLTKLEHLKSLTLDHVQIPAEDLAAFKARVPKVEVKWTAADERALTRIRRAFDGKK